MVSLKKILNKILVRINSEADYVVEQGTIDGWDYIKWNSGKAECFLEGDQYYEPSEPVTIELYKVATQVNLPTIFITKPSHIYASPMDSTTQDIISMYGYAIDSETIKFYGWKPTSNGTFIYASFHVIGNWK